MDFGKAAGAFVLGGLSGGAAEYSRIQREQEKFAQEQALRDVEELRQQRLKEFGVKLEMKSKAIGQRADGTFVTQGEVQDGTVQPGTYSTERQIKLEDAKSGQFLNGRELTNAEVKALTPEQQAQLKTGKQEALEQHEAIKKIDAKYREPRVDALGNAKQLYDYKDKKEREALEQARDSKIITEEEYQAGIKALVLGPTGVSASKEDSKLLPGVNKLRDAVTKAGEKAQDDWESQVAEAKAFSTRYEKLSEKEKAQADQLFPDMGKEADIILGVEKYAKVATQPNADDILFSSVLNKRGVKSKSDPGYQEALAEAKEIKSLYNEVYQVTEVDGKGMGRVFEFFGADKRKQVTRKE